MSLCTAPSTGTLHTIHCTLYIHCVLSTVHCTLHTVHGVPCALSTALCTMVSSSSCSALCTIRYTLYTVHCTLLPCGTVHLHTFHYSFTLHRTRYSAHHTPIHAARYTVHCTLYTVATVPLCYCIHWHASFNPYCTLCIASTVLVLCSRLVAGYIGHTYITHNYIGHNYIGHNYNCPVFPLDSQLCVVKNKETSSQHTDSPMYPTQPMAG